MRLTALAALVLAGACSAAAPTDPATSDMAAGEARAITARGRAIDGDTVSIDIRLSGSGHRTGTDIRVSARTYGSTLCVDDSSIPKASIGQL